MKKMLIVFVAVIAMSVTAKAGTCRGAFCEVKHPVVIVTKVVGKTTFVLEKAVRVVKKVHLLKVIRKHHRGC